MRFHLFQLWFLIPGVLLVVVSVYIPLSYLHKQIFWTETEALIADRVDYYMTFTDEQGITRQIRPNPEDSFMEGKDSNHVRIFYDPSSPEDFELVNPGRYMLILFLPLGLFCSYLGWPERRSG